MSDNWQTIFRHRMRRFEVRQRRGSNIAAVALAAKHARLLWALLARGHEYRLVA